MNVMTQTELPHDPGRNAETALQTIAKSGTELRAAWLAYGKALNEIREDCGGDDKVFGQRLKDDGLNTLPLSQNGTVEIKRDVRLAAQWAAENPEQLVKAEAKEPDREVTMKGGFRGLHEVWKRLASETALAAIKEAVPKLEVALAKLKVDSPKTEDIRAFVDLANELEKLIC